MKKWVDGFVSKKYLSILVIVISMIYSCRHTIKEKIWVEPSTPIMWDVLSYYEYLPAVFIHGDWSLSFLDKKPKLEGYFWHSKGPNNSRVIRTSMGMSIMYMPFFLVAHALAPAFGYPQDGFSDPYEFAIIFGSLIISTVGLIFIRKILLLYFNDIVISLTLVSLMLGTNLFYYTTIEGGMTHAWLFCLYAIFFYLCIKWNNTKKNKFLVIAVAVCGLMVLIRPTEIIALLIPLLIGVSSWKLFQERLLFFIKNYLTTLICAVVFILPFSLQMIYWKDVTGSWLYYSYQEYGFFWDEPMILDGLFSYRKGWFVYTPIAIFFVAGFFVLYKRGKEFFYPLLILFLLNLYITFSWCIWWYGGGFGMRAMIQSTAVLAISMAFFYDFILKQHMALRVILIELIAYFVFLNVFQTIQYRGFMLHWDSMTKAAYWYTFHKSKMYPGEMPIFESLLKAPDYESRKKK